MWAFSEETKARYGKQKRKGFVEAILEIETNPEIALEIRCENHRNTGQFSYSNGPNMSDCQMVRFSSVGRKTGQIMFCMYSRLSRSFTAKGVSCRDPTKGIRLISF